MTPVVGLPNQGELKALKNSARNCVVTRSRIWNSLKIERSQLPIPSLRMSGEYRAWLPKVNGAGWEKTLVSNHSSSRSCGWPDSSPLWPLLFGSVSGLKSPVLLLAEIESGVPLW